MTKITLIPALRSIHTGRAIPPDRGGAGHG